MQTQGCFVAQLEVLCWGWFAQGNISPVLFAASRVGKFHRLTLGLYVTIAEIRVLFICYKHEK
jgi:hypothetical protein